MDDLTFRIFENTDEGKEFLSLLRDAFYSVRLLPISADRISKYGSLESYLAYHEGQRSIVNLIEASITVMKFKMKGVEDE